MGYRENRAETSMEAAFAEAFIAKRREQEKALMTNRATAIDKGSRHETPAAKTKRVRRTQHAD